MNRLCAALLFLLAALPARAADCAPPQLVSQIPMTPIPTGDGSLVETVPVAINGEQVNFILDTGGVQTQISAALAARLNLPINRTGDALVDVTGQQTAGLAMIHDFTFGADTRHDEPLLVSPNKVVLTGLLSLNHLTPYDVEMDFGNNLLKLYSPDHCAGATALPASATVLPFAIKNGHITVAATLDGQQITAILDSGASATDLPANVATTSFAVVPGASDTPATAGLNGAPGLVFYTHTFDQLTLGPVSVSAPRVNIIPSGATQGPELIIGMNVLKPLDLYFAFAEGKLYLMPSAAP